MKKVLFTVGLMATIAVVSCNKEESTTGESEVYEVKIGMSNAITSDITDLTKSLADGDVIGIDVWSCPDNGSTTYSPYAYGLFDTDDISVSLISGYKYKFTARSGKYSEEEISFDYCVHKVGSTSLYGFGSVPNKFYYAGNTYMSSCSKCSPIDLYYGETTDYVPTKGGTVTIDMVRVSFGLSISVKNLSEGSVTVKVSGNGFSSFDDVTITSTGTPYYSLYAMSEFGKSFAQSDYYEELIVTGSLTNTDNVTTPLGSATVKVMRNKLTRINIDATAPSTDNGFNLTYSTEEIGDGDTYEIGGGVSTLIRNPLLPGKFSVSATEKVQFSRGNLQATYNGSSYMWGFAINQYDYVGNAAGNTSIDSQTEDAIVDLFGWSTTTAYGINTSTTTAAYSGNFSDWGNIPDLPGNSDNKKIWRTLSTTERVYLLNTRGSSDSKRFAKAQVHSVNGLIIFPDDYKGITTGIHPGNINTSGYSYFDAIADDDWTSMESAGCVFLPAAGDRSGSNVSGVGLQGSYWLSTSSDTFAYFLSFNSDDVSLSTSTPRYSGLSVRLVSAAQ